MNTRVWISVTEDKYISDIVRTLTGSGCVVELGTFRGGTTELFAEIVPYNISVWTIDIYKIHNDWVRDLGDYNAVTIYKNYFEGKYSNVFFIVGDSLNVGRHWSKPIELLFLDADHGRDITKQNFIEWDRNIVSGGYAIFHDNVWKPSLLDEILSEYPNYEFHSEFDITGVIRKK